MTYFCRLNVDQLIVCVHKRPALWNRHCDSHNNRYKSKQLWDEVASELNMSVENVKKKWNNLRDQFRKEYVRLNKPGKSDTVATIKTSSWSYYEKLLFLAKQILPKSLREHRHSPPPSEVDSPDDDVSEDNGASSPFDGTLSESKSAQIISVKNSLAEQSFREPVKQVCICKTKKRNLDVDQEPVDAEKPKHESIKHRRNYSLTEDPDRNFLMSLIPYLTEVPRCRKLIVQRRLLDVFMEEERTKDWDD